MGSAMVNVMELTLELIKEEEQNLIAHVSKGSLMDVFRGNFEVWDGQLFPLLKMQGKNRYEFLSRLLKKAGYVVSTDQVGLYLSKVRNEKGIKKTYKVKKNKGRDVDSVVGLTSEKSCRLVAIDNSINSSEVAHDN